MKTIPLDQWFSAINAGDPGLVPVLGTMKTIPLDQWFSAINAEDPGLIPVLVWYPGEGIGYPLQYSWASLVAQLQGGKESSHNVGDLDLIPRLGRFSGYE